MSFYHTEPYSFRDAKSSAENEAIEGLEPGGLSPEMSRDFGADALQKIANEILRDAIRRGDKSLAQKCDRVLARYDLAYPNRTSGLWEPLEVPRSELQVREVYATKLPDYGYQLVASHTDFPDWLLLDTQGNYVYCEVEHRSSSFILHGHDASRCDLIACWEHDWPECPLPVLEFFSGNHIEPTVPAPEPKSKARLSVNFAGTLSKQIIKPNFAARKERGEFAVKRYYELKSDERSVEDVCAEIGKELGTTASAVRQLLKNRGVLGRVRARRRAVIDKFQEMRGEYDTKSAAVGAVAEHFGIAPGTVWSHLSRGGA